MVDCRFRSNWNKNECRKKYPYKSTKEQLNTAVVTGNRKIKNSISKTDYNFIKSLNKKIDSLKQNTTITGMLNKRREHFHDKIIEEQFRGVKSDLNDPDFYILGGLPASGKSSVLLKKIPEKGIIVDSDYYKGKLTQKSKSPSHRFKLIHAQLLHEESDLLVNKAITKAIRQRKNVILDATFGNLAKGKALIERFKQAGYDVHYLGNQKYPHKTIRHMTERFLKGKEGRYVPLAYVKEKGNTISENSWKARKFADTYQVYDVNSRKPRLIIKSKKGIKHNFRDP